MTRVLRIGFGCVLVLVLADCAWAQATAQINGTVTDSSGGVLPGATVTAIQTDTGFRREMVTNDARRVHADEPADRALPSRGHAGWASARMCRPVSCLEIGSIP